MTEEEFISKVRMKMDESLTMLAVQMWQDHLECIEYWEKIDRGEIPPPRMCGLSEILND